ncbi:MAG: FAD:protein FMN transferase [Anaerovoracaceae bacterium]
MKKKLLLVLICTLVIITQVGCGTKEPVSKTGFYLNTSCQIDIMDMNKTEGEKIIDQVFEECGNYEKMLSRTVKGSDIYKINHAKGKPVTVAPETAYLIKTSIEMSEKTNGQFDITVGKLTDLWNFSSDNPKKPKDADIKEAVKTIGYKNIVIKGNTVQLKNPETWLDLGAIAKGYIADKLTASLEEKGVKTGIVNLGGNIVTIGAKADGSPWNIGIETPYSDRNDIVGAVKMKDQTVVTSGTYERFFEEGGKKYHHILNPKTGYPVNSDIEGVSILSKKGNSGYCDAYSTISLLLGKEKAKEFMSKQDGFEFMIIDTKGKDFNSKGFNIEYKE